MKTLIIKAVLLFCIFNLFNNQLIAQQTVVTGGADYRNAIGIRLGGTSGIDYKHKFNPHNSLELILGTYPNAFGLTGLYEANVFTKVTGLNLYFGGGAHIARTYGRSYRSFDNDRYNFYTRYGARNIIGVDAIAGLEYKIQDVPLVLSLDAKPTVEFYSVYGSYFRLDPSVGIKFTF